ncbi:proliferation-associated protein 2G4 [Rhinophrynus dorsalis]
MSGDDEQQEQTIAEDLVVTKYKMGGDIANRVLRTLVEAATAETSILNLCEKGDAMIMEETGKIFKKEKEMKKAPAPLAKLQLFREAVHSLLNKKVPVPPQEQGLGFYYDLFVVLKDDCLPILNLVLGGLVGLHSHPGIHMTPYLYNILLKAPSEKLLTQQELVFLGMRFDTHLGKIFLPQDKILEIMQNVIQALEWPSVREYMRVLGPLMSSLEAVPYSQVHTRELQRLVIQMCPYRTPVSNLEKSTSWTLQSGHGSPSRVFSHMSFLLLSLSLLGVVLPYHRTGSRECFLCSAFQMKINHHGTCSMWINRNGFNRDLGVHVDGFIANVAHSFVVGASKDCLVTGRKADVIKAAHLCAEAALRLVKPGNQNTQVTEAWNKITPSFNCTPIEGMLSHQLKQHVIDGEKTIIQNPTDQQKKDHEKAEFEVHEVYAVDVLVSTGEGKAKDAGQRTTIYKRDPTKQYGLKMKTSRAFFSEVERRFDGMPFTLRAFEDEKKARMGVVECAKHELLQPFNVLYEKEGECVAQFKFTVLLMPNGPMRITSGPFESDVYKSEFEVQDAELKALLQSSASRKTQKKKKKKASKNAENATAEENEGTE